MSDRRPERLWDCGFPAWRLPADGTAAGSARSIVRGVYSEFGMPSGMTHDATVIVSELAADAIVRAGRTAPPRAEQTAGGPEIWAYVSRRRSLEIVLKVFAPVAGNGPVAPSIPHAPPDATSARGLEVVDALATEHGGRWGVHPTRGRLGPGSLPGKAVFFTMPLPDDRWGGFARPEPNPERPSAERIGVLLADRGLRPRLSAGHGMAVVEVRTGLHIWVYGRSLSYRLPGRGVVWHPPFDEIEVVEQVVRHCEEFTGSGVAALS